MVADVLADVVADEEAVGPSEKTMAAPAARETSRRRRIRAPFEERPAALPELAAP
jgi:hypothetical protein